VIVQLDVFSVITHFNLTKQCPTANNPKHKGQVNQHKRRTNIENDYVAPPVLFVKLVGTCCAVVNTKSQSKNESESD
jgi:hypothetical protein